jgi:hypothetical protein
MGQMMLSRDELARGNRRRRSITIASAILAIERRIAGAELAAANTSDQVEIELEMESIKVLSAASQALRWAMGQDIEPLDDDRELASLLGVDQDGL